MRMFNPDLIQPHAGVKPSGAPSGVMGTPDMGGVGQGMPVLMAPSNTVAPPAPPQPQTAASTQSTGGGVGSFFDLLGNFLGDNAGALAGIGSIAGALDNAGDVRDMGYAVQQHLENMGQNLNDGSQFQGYGVTSGTGENAINSTVNADGSINLNVGQDMTMAGNGSSNLTGAQNAFNNALGMSGGQGNVDWNAIAQNQMGASNGVNPNTGAFGAQGQQLFGNAMGMNPNQGWAGQTAQDAADRSMADPSQRQSEIFDQLMAIQNPELDRQQAAQQAQEYAMGRGGIRGSAYGGTAEDAAMAKARAQSSNQAALNAMQQADSERSMFGQMASQYGQLGQQNYANQSNQMANLLNASSQQGQLGNQNYANMTDRETALANNAAQFGQLGNQANANATQQAGMMGQIGNSLAALGLDQTKLSYLPMQQQMELLKLGQGTGAMAQQGQLTGQDYLAQMLLGGTNANVNAQKVSSELMGNLYDSILDNLGGASNADGSTSGIGGMLGSLGGLFGSLFD